MPDTPFTVIEGRYFRDLMAQPQALDSTHAWLNASGRWGDTRRFVGARKWKRIVLTGMGASYHTLHPLNLSLIDSGFNPIMIETSELIHYGLPLCDAETLIVAVSQSGGSAETLRLLELNRDASLLGVTNTESSPLAKGSDLALLVQAGPEFSVSCKTYVAGMMALQWLAAIFADGAEDETLRRLEPAGLLVERYLQSWPTHASLLADKLRGMRHVFFAGRGSSLAAVGAGALIVKESARFHAEGMSSAAFRHGPIEMSQKDMFTAVFSGDDRTRALNHRLAQELIARGQPCDEIDEESTCPPFRLPACDPLLQPIVEILPAQMMTLTLAGLAGREAGNFEHAAKITDKE
jgi:glucosamine--fructose-6-phosphate aminotransferase (isomerizing)